MNNNIQRHITVNPKIMIGKPVIRGTRVPVELIVRMVAQDVPEVTILKEYPNLKAGDIRAALAYAAQVIAHEDIFPLRIPA